MTRPIDRSRPLAIRGARVWDGESGAVLPGRPTVRVEGGRIAAVAVDDALVAGAEVVDADGGTLLPGLIDAHVHLDLDPARRTPEEQAELSDAERWAALRERAAAMLRAGITTARDLGGPAWRELALRDEIAAGETPGPRVLCAGQPLTSPMGHCWFWGGEIHDDAQLAATVLRQLEHGVDWIKVMATGGVITKGTRATDAQFSREQIAQVVARAAADGRHVAAHCHGTAGIRNAAGARVRTIEHCSFASDDGFGLDAPDDAIDELARAGSHVSPTINAGWKRFYGKREQPSRFWARMSGIHERLKRAGVPLIASTDAGIPNVEHARLPEALPVFAQLAGLSAVETLRSATSASALALGLEGETGRVTEGLAADLLLVDGNPLEDLSALLRVRCVLAKGRALHPGSTGSQETDGFPRVRPGAPVDSS